MSDVLIRACSFVAIILLGYVLKKVGLFKDADFPILSNVVMKITFPAAIITSLSGRQIEPSMLVLLPLASCCGLFYMLVAALINLRSSKEQRAFDILNLPGYNIGNFSMPFVQSFLGPTGVIAAGIFDMGNAAITLGTAYGVASAVKTGAKFSFKRVLKALGTSVPFLTYMSMLLLSLLRISLPAPVIQFAGIIGNANPFLAMFMIGVGFKLSGDKSQIKKIVQLLSLRYGFAVLIALLFWFVLPFELEVRQALVLLAFSPIAAAVPPFTAELKGDVGLSSAINSVAILCGVVCNVILLGILL
jgi:predicted permease